MSDNAYPGWQDIFDQKEPYNATAFLIRQMMAGYSHVALVLVIDVTASDTDGAPPTVDVQPMVAMVDQTGTAQDHGTIYKIPVFRPQAGNSAFICDPRKDDIGFVVCADRDISSAFANQAPANPGSFRRFDWADALYVGGVATVAPTTWVEVNDDTGVTIQVASGNTLTINADTVNIADSSGSGSATVSLTGSLTATVDVVAGTGSISLTEHVHGGVQSGPDDTGPPS